MRLKSITLKNFRCFEHLELVFDSKLTVIVAENGAGKTAILDAIATGFGRYLTKLGKKGQTLKQSDLQVSEQEKLAPYVGIEIALEVRENTGPRTIVWSLTRKNNPASKIDTSFAGTKAIDDFAAQLLHQQDDGLTPLFPLVVYYGTNRGILGEVQRSRNFKKKFAPLDALDGALEPTARFKAAFEWFNAMEDEERREREKRKDFSYRMPHLEYVRRAIEDALSNLPAEGVFDATVLPVLFRNPRTETRPLRFVIDQHLPDCTRTLRINQLSDGYRIMLGLVMDLARRQAEAFSFNRNVIGGFGSWPSIVLIDEVDLHLHPRWQQMVLSQLQRIFRTTQFIVTTHSPQVLSMVRRENIRVLGQNSADMPLSSTYGQPSGDVMHSVMLVDPQPPIAEKPQLNELTELVDTGHYHLHRASELFETLQAALQEHHPQLLTLRRNIRRMEALKRVAPP